MIGAAILRYDPGFIEEAIFFAARRSPEARAFRRERDRLYEISDIEERDRAFQQLNLKWFKGLELAAPIEKAVDEQPLVSSTVKWCVVARAPGKKEEGAELFVSAEASLSEQDRRSVRLLLRPASLLDPEQVLTFLRHELFHITDMLDPAFGYEPSLPAAEGGLTHDSLLRERYRTLWDATINGRMTRRNWLPPSARAEDFRSFICAFPMFAPNAAEVFAAFFDREPHTHAELAAFARGPRSAPYQEQKLEQENRCPLCRFPTFTFEPEPERLEREVIAEIRRDFPSWQPSQRLCIQCADLYRARRVSVSAALLLPGPAVHRKKDDTDEDVLA